MAQEQRGIRQGMTVYSSDGEKLGKVLECQAETFIIEKGFFFPKDYIARYDDVSGIDGDEVSLRFAKDAFTSGAREAQGSEIGGGGASYGGETATRGSEASMRGAETGMRGSETMRSGQDVSVPIAEEELDVAKRERRAGEVRLKKDVVTEHERVDVPVTKERVRVEHVPASERSTTPAEGAFEEKTVSVPVHEEEVEIRKRPVVKEEVRLRKERQVEQRAAEADLRKERVEIEGDGEHTVRDGDVRGGSIDPDRDR